MRLLTRSQGYYMRRARKIARQQKKWEIEKINIQKENDIKNEYSTILNKNPYKITTSKLAMWFLFFLCLGIIFFTGYITLKEFSLAYAFGLMPDFTPLIAMIGGILGATADVAAYFAKSAKENSKGGITYEAAAAVNFIEEPIKKPLGTQYDQLFGKG